MTGRIIRATLLAAVVAAIATGAAGAITPANGGDAGGTLVAINATAGDQTEPRVGGDLAVYTHKDFFAGSTLHYFDFTTGSDHVVPAELRGTATTSLTLTVIESSSAGPGRLTAKPR